MFNNLTNEQLQSLYLAAKEEYYNNVPINLPYLDKDKLTDYEFDTLEDILKEKGFDVVAIVGAKVEDKRFKVKHLEEQKSLAKIQFSKEEIPTNQLTNFLQKIAPYQNNGYKLEGTVKLDGNSGVLVYENGLLKYATSRGDGKFGFDITHKVKHSVLKNISIEGLVQIKGEFVIDKFIFEKLYSDKYANPRNFVSGKLNPENDDILPELSFVAYDIKVMNTSSLDYVFSDNNKILNQLGFETPLQFNFGNSLNELLEAYEFFKSKRASYKYQLDGVVIKSHSETRKILGENSHSPHWAVALKFPPEEQISTIVSIDWNLGKTGKLTPVGVIQPILLDGSTVTRCTLHNIGHVEKNKLFPGAVVKVAKKGDIIPQIIEVVIPSNNLTYLNDITLIYPQNLNKDLIERDGVHLLYKDSEMQNIRLLQGAIELLEIEDLGKSSVEGLYDFGLRSVKDYFSKSKRKMAFDLYFNSDSSMPEKLNKRIEDIKEINLSLMIQLLQIENVGKRFSDKIAQYLAGQNVDWSGFNKSIVLNVLNNKSLLRFSISELENDLKKEGVNILYPTISKIGKITFEMTGEPTTHSKKKLFIDDVKDFAEHTSLTKDTNYLVCDSLDSNSGKMSKAKKLGVTIITYEDFLKEIKCSQ